MFFISFNKIFEDFVLRKIKVKSSKQRKWLREKLFWRQSGPEKRTFSERFCECVYRKFFRTFFSFVEEENHQIISFDLLLKKLKLVLLKDTNWDKMSWKIFLCKILRFWIKNLLFYRSRNWRKLHIFLWYCSCLFSFKRNIKISQKRRRINFSNLDEDIP